ncbi:MAG: tetratricopeptide repeat protein [Acidobacteriaceae bacterium]
MKRRQRTILTIVLLVSVAWTSAKPILALQSEEGASAPASSKVQPTGEHKGQSVNCRTNLDSHNVDRLIEKGNYRQAIISLRHAKQCNSSDIALREQLIVAYLKSNQKRQAGEEAESAAQGASPDGKIHLAHVLNANGDFSDAEAMLQHLVESGVVLAGVHGELGVALLGRGQYEDSVRELGSAVQIDSSAEGYTLELARALLSWGNYQTALAFLEAIGGRFGENPTYLYEKAWAFYGMHRFSDAVDTLQSLLQQKPSWDLAQFSLGNAYWMQGHIAEAEKQYRVAIKLNSRSASYYVALGRVLRKNTDTLPEAISGLNEAINLEPHNVVAEFELALAYRSQRNYQKAKHLLEDVTAREPAMVDAHRVLGLVYYQLRAPDDGARQMAIAAGLETNELRQAGDRNSVTTSADAPAYQ